MFPASVNDLGVIDDFVDLVLGAVAAHVIFANNVVQRGFFIHTVDDVLKDLLLAFDTGGATEKPLLKKRLARGLVFAGHYDPPLFGVSGVVASLLRASGAGTSYSRNTPREGGS
jgi:hypothetical protein